MQTTLRLSDVIYREAKVEAAREGMTMTRFLEEALRLRIRFGRQAARTSDVALPVFDSGVRVPSSFELSAAVREAGAEADKGIAKRLLSGGKER